MTPAAPLPSGEIRTTESNSLENIQTLTGPDGPLTATLLNTEQFTRDLTKKGVAFSKIALVPVWRETGSTFSQQERAALQWAETLTLVSQTHAPDDAYRSVTEHFGEKEVVDLTIAIGLMNTFNRIAIGFGRGPDVHA